MTNNKHIKNNIKSINSVIGRLEIGKFCGKRRVIVKGLVIV